MEPRPGVTKDQQSSNHNEVKNSEDTADAASSSRADAPESVAPNDQAGAEHERSGKQNDVTSEQTHPSELAINGAEPNTSAGAPEAVTSL